MYKVLHVMSGADGGGISNVVLNYYKHIDRDLIHFDIAFIQNSAGYMADEFKQMGANIYELPLKSKSVSRYKAELQSLIQKNKYDAVHIHENDTSFVGLHVAKKMGVKQRIAHSHTSAPYCSLMGEIKRRIGCFLNYHYASCAIACGELAGERIFGKSNMKRKKAVILPNAVDLSKFKYDIETRKKIRTDFNLSDNYVIGMVGRLAPEKNFPFALKVIKMVHEKLPETVFLIVGDGDEKEHIKELVCQERMENYVRLLGPREDVEMLYQCFDVLIVPSLHEGFPLVAVEGLASGLNVLLSSNITREFEKYPPIKYCSLDELNEWVDEINNCYTETDVDRENRMQILEHSRLNIKNVAKELEKIYLT